MTFSASNTSTCHIITSTTSIETLGTFAKSSWSWTFDLMRKNANFSFFQYYTIRSCLHRSLVVKKSPLFEFLLHWPFWFCPSRLTCLSFCWLHCFFLASCFSTNWHWTNFQLWKYYYYKKIKSRMSRTMLSLRFRVWKNYPSMGIR